MAGRFRDYRLYTLQTQLRFNNLPQKLIIGADYLYNGKDYSASDPDEFTAFHADDTDGYVLQVVYGDVKERWDWVVGAYYSYIEQLAIHNSYAEDEWVRWGDSNQTTASNMRGYELRAGLGLGWNMNLIMRFWDVRAIGLEQPTDVSRQTGNRWRLDWNFAF